MESKILLLKRLVLVLSRLIRYLELSPKLVLVFLSVIKKVYGGEILFFIHSRQPFAILFCLSIHLIREKMICLQRYEPKTEKNRDRRQCLWYILYIYICLSIFVFIVQRVQSRAERTGVFENHRIVNFSCEQILFTLMCSYWIDIRQNHVWKTTSFMLCSFLLMRFWKY